MSAADTKQKLAGAEKREFTHSSHEGGDLVDPNGPNKVHIDENDIPTYMGMSGNKLGVMITVAASMGFCLFGYDQGVMSGLISAPQFFRVFPACDPARQGAYKGTLLCDASRRASQAGLCRLTRPVLSAASVLQAFYVAIYEVGCLAGAVFALMFGDRLGRRKMMFSGAIILVIGVIIQITAFSGSWAGGQFIIGRIVTGLGTGFETSTIPTWHAECAKAHSRGFAVFIEAAMISTGTMIAYWIDFGFSYLDNSASWRVPIALQCIFAVALVALLLFLPESPRWLVSKGHYAEAQKVIAALEPAPYNDATVVLQLKVINDSLEGQTRQRKRDLITNGPTQHARRMLLGASSQFFQQVGGCNAVIYFSTPIFEEYLGLGRKLSLILGSVLATVYALSACISFPLVDKAGRRKLFFIGTWGQALSMFLIMGCLIPGKDSNAVNGAVVGIFLYLTFFGFTWLELPWLYPAEINPLKTRTTANAVSTINNWLFNFTVVMFTPPFLASTSVGCFAFFGAVNLCFLPVIYFFYPETAGRSLEEIDIIFARGYVEKVSYVKMAKIMPRLSGAEIEGEWRRLGLSDEERPSAGDGAEGFNSVPGTVSVLRVLVRGNVRNIEIALIVLPPRWTGAPAGGAAAMKRTRGKNDRESRLARVPAPKIALAILLAIYSDIFFEFLYTNKDARMHYSIGVQSFIALEIGAPLTEPREEEASDSLPVIYFFYPETAGRSLEEIDIIFARGYVEKVSYVKMAKIMPLLSGAEIEGEWRRHLQLAHLPDTAGWMLQTRTIGTPCAGI
ncbi:hypothetical protein C6P46_004953 [Rhodotorula mucilaginosa]|uniref:Major facilitator superfamily (MFS) profile domain-containing protein n=1 Tax=Rhodotorula mucilaginosa TaxID=5537 RepID=A0A9P7B9K8_RHOMI|nr:hypothetical protein C6P46_004953 [Rhodotorula mucilaginosa]